MIDRILFPEQIHVGLPQKTPQPKTSGDVKTPFSTVLDGKLPTGQVKFSQHAQDRLRARGINLTEADMQKLQGAVDTVAQKGGRESLVMMGDAAFVVSVRNRTVVTALDGDSMNGNVFTNIDSAVVVK